MKTKNTWQEYIKDIYHAELFQQDYKCTNVNLPFSATFSY